MRWFTEVNSSCTASGYFVTTLTTHLRTSNRDTSPRVGHSDGPTVATHGKAGWLRPSSLKYGCPDRLG